MDATRLVTSLRAAYRTGMDDRDKAATELLIWHEYWLRRSDFASECVRDMGDGAYLRWQQAREFLDREPHASTSELAVLDLAVAIGENRFRLSSMGGQHRKMIAHAVAAAVGLADATEWPR